MSENLEAKAVELSDDELDNISGGKAMIVNDIGGRTRAIYTCSRKKVNADQFYQHLRCSVRCERFEKKPGIHAYNDPLYTDCRDCIYFNCDSRTLDDAERILDPKSYKKSGYDFMYF